MPKLDQQLVDGIIESWNPGGARIKGYEAAEIIGRPIATLYTPDDVRDGKPALNLQIAARAGRFEGVTGDQWQRTGARSDGARFTVETFARYFVHDPVHHLYDVTGQRAVQT